MPSCPIGPLEALILTHLYMTSRESKARYALDAQAPYCTIVPRKSKLGHTLDAVLPSFSQGVRTLR